MTSRLRILHCPLNNANTPWVLSRAERKLGLKSDLIVFKKHPFYPRNYDRLIEINGINIPNEIKRISFLKWARKNYDVFHFNFGQSIWDHPFPGLNYLDLPKLKKEGKKIVITFQGDDIRQKDFFLNHFGQGHYGTKKYSLNDMFSDYNKRLRSRKIARYADEIFAFNPDLLYILPQNAHFLPYPNTYSGPSISKKTKSKKITIVHAPSDRVVKGSHEIICIVNKLASKYPINLILVENLPHTQALKVYQKADIAIDQLRVGWYGGFAVETMAMGIPTIAFLRQTDLEKFVPFRNEIPIVNTNIDNLEKKIEELIKKPDLRYDISKKCRQFVEKYHHPLKIAQKTKKIYEDLCAE